MELRKYLKKNRGAANQLARAMSVTPQSIWGWCSVHRIPAERVLQIWELTGRIVHPYEMRPDIYPPEKIKFSREAEAKTGVEDV